MKNSFGINFRFVVLLFATVGVYGLSGCDKKTAENVPQVQVTELKTLYQCPMHQHIIRDHPGTCPLCGMALVAISGNIDSEAQSMSNDGGMEGTVVRIDPTVTQNIGVRTEKVGRRLLASELRLDGRVVIDESKVRSVTARVMGYVEKLNASTSGQTVREGETLLELYSPDLLSAQEELLQALRYREESPGALELVHSARLRLLNWGVSEAFADELEKTGVVRRRIPILSPLSGVLVRKNVVEGQAVSPGMELFQIADLRTVWITARVFQADLAVARVGSPATVRFRNLPGRDFSARVFFVSPEMDAATRTAEIRMQLPNTPAMELRPEMFAGVVLHGPADSVLAVPAQAILHSGTREIAIVSLGEGRFQPRVVHTGRSADGYVEILNGLSVGETVVVSSQFLIDSESNLRAAIAQMQAGDGAVGATRRVAPTAPTGESHGR